MKNKEEKWFARKRETMIKKEWMVTESKSLLLFLSWKMRIKKRLHLQ